MNKQIDISELRRLIEVEPNLQLVDVRSAGEFAAGHVPKALNIPLEELETRFQDLSSGPVAILCQSGRRAGLACDMFRTRHDGLLLVEGGTQAWIAQGLPVVRSTSAGWSLERQVRLIAGLMVLIGTVLAAYGVSFGLYLAMFVGVGLTFAGLTNICGMALLLARLPWNRPSAGTTCEAVTAVKS